MDVQNFTVRAGANDVDALRGALAEGVDINGRTRQAGWTALHWAIRGGASDAVAFLIEQGADLNARGKLGDTPLHVAITAAHRSGDPGLVRMLLAAGADPTIENNYGISAVQTARDSASFPDEIFDEYTGST